MTAYRPDGEELVPITREPVRSRWEEGLAPWLSTEQARARLAARGIVADIATIQRWCQKWRFHEARKVGPERRGTWTIPQIDVDTFWPPEPRAEETARGRATAILRDLHFWRSTEMPCR